MSLYRTNNIEIILEGLGLLKITNKASEETNKWSDKEISVAPVPTNENIQVIVSKSTVPDPGWFNRDQTKFEDWWRGIWLFFKGNRVIKTDDRIMAILACLKEDMAGIYA